MFNLVLATIEELEKRVSALELNMNNLLTSMTIIVVILAVMVVRMIYPKFLKKKEPVPSA